MGIEAGPDGSVYVVDNQGWLGEEKGQNQGRIIKIVVENDEPVDYKVIAEGLSHPNAIRYHNGDLYVTQSMLPKFKTAKLTSAIYRFKATDRAIKVNNDESDAQYIVKTFLTHDMNDQYGLDGLVFDSKGYMYTGNFGDGTVFKMALDENGNVSSTELYALGDDMATTDGMTVDKDDNIYVADFSKNRLVKIDNNGIVTEVSKNGDCDGSDGCLDQPGEPIIFEGKVVVSNFDIVTGPDKVNLKHDAPHTLSYIELKDIE